MGGNLIDHPQAFVKLMATVVRLVNLSGAATLEAIHRELPYSGYRVDEVLACMDAMVEAGVLNVPAPRLFVAGPSFPQPPEVDG